MLPRRSTLLILAVLLAVICSVLPGTTPTPAKAQNTIQDTPIALVPEGVTQYAFAPPKIFWQTGVAPCPPNLQAGDVQIAQAGTETVKRIATTGGMTRLLYSKQQACSTGQFNSNMIADAKYLYWIGPDGLMRLSVEANPGDLPEVFNAGLKGYKEVAQSNSEVFALMSNANGTAIVATNKTTGANTVKSLLSDPNGYRFSFDGTYFYYFSGQNLRRLTQNNDVRTIAVGASAYYAEGRRLTLCPINATDCVFSSNVYVGIGNKIFRYDNNQNSLGNAIYTSSDSEATMAELVTSFSKLIFFERRPLPCDVEPCFTSYNYVLNRASRSGGAADVLYTTGPVIFTPVSQLNTDGTFLFWQGNGALQRLPLDVSALPVINMRVTGIEVTQGIQNLTNSVLLIKNRRTFVRVYVKSDGASVAGVTARLAAPGFTDTTLLPVNSVGTKISVRGTPDRTDLNQSFLFELPWSWTQQNNLSLRAELNPYEVPLEPNYTDNSSTVNVQFKVSPTLSVEFFRLNYTIGGTTYSPRLTKDVLQTYSWIMRAYPIGGSIGQNFKPRLWRVDGGTQLGSWVDRSSDDCEEIYPDADDRNLCASYFTNNWLKYYRDATSSGDLDVGLKTNAFYYGMISDGAAFPRGQARHSKTSVGPTGSGSFGWDFDGSYADWYAAHEIGHSLGRGHTGAGSDDPATKDVSENCGHSRTDTNYPYGNTTTSRAPIGPNSGSMEGFDVGDPSFGINRSVLPSSIWNDVMSYCNNQWLSDYTYTAMYNYMIGSPSLAEEQPQIAVNGDLLSLTGALDTTGDTASLSFVRRLSSAAEIPALTPGGYAIKLLDGSNATLATYAFTPEESEDGGDLAGFNQIVPFVAGTRQLQVVRLSDNLVLTSAPVSASAPTVSNVVLQNAPNPVTGVVTLGWTASDSDGDNLTFEISYSRDNGATFQPIAMGVTGNSTSIDTADLGGSGTAIFRILASDGVNTGSGDSAPFTMAAKPPQPYILAPGNTTHIHYGQLVNFNGMAFDAQDSTVDDAGLVWKNAKGDTLGTGALISVDDLPVGTNVVTLEATNSVGEKATTTVTIVVDDDLSDPSATLSVGPGQVGWHISAGEVAAQTAQLSITNAGSGDMDWTATSDQPWLTLSADSGNVAADGDPTTLTVTAAPAGLVVDTPHVAHVTITRPASGDTPAQTVIIPVSLSIGNVFETYEPVPTPSGGAQTIYLPIVLK